MASDKNHRPCLPLKPQEKVFDFPGKFLKKVIISLNELLSNKSLNYHVNNRIELCRSFKYRKRKERWEC
jgi:hypothetical protein